MVRDRLARLVCADVAFLEEVDLLLRHYAAQRPTRKPPADVRDELAKVANLSPEARTALEVQLWLEYGVDVRLPELVQQTIAARSGRARNQRRGELILDAFLLFGRYGLEFSARSDGPLCNYFDVICGELGVDYDPRRMSRDATDLYT
jgi:hypothetical protein